MSQDHERIAREMSDPALVRLHRKLERLASVLTVMNTGAHPDDEASGLLAALRFGFGMRIVIACSTRGEGGQNAIGPERGAALGILRTREMEEAARVLDADVAWLGHGPDDPVHDFGFSRNGDDTLARWGEDRIVERLVRAYREERPDIVIPTFLDVPGQHGHHRAMTRAARTAVDRAADPTAYSAHMAEGLKPWQISKFYLPAWSGGGSTYDDEVLPPRASLVVRAPGDDVATGVPFARIGEWSRARHLSQGMGTWLETPPRSWPLHLLLSTQGVHDETDIREGLPATVARLAEDCPGDTARHLVTAQEAIDEARAAFPRRPQILAAAVAAAKAITAALALCSDRTCDRIGHRLVRKLRELDDVIVETARLHVRARAVPPVVAPGGQTVLHVTVDAADVRASIEPVTSPDIALTGRRQRGPNLLFDLDIPANASFSSPYPRRFRTLGHNGAVAVAVAAEIEGHTARSVFDLDEALSVLPERCVAIDPDAAFLNLAEKPRPFAVKTSVGGDDHSVVMLTVPEGWSVARHGDTLRVCPPVALEPGLYRLDGLVDERPAYRSTPVAYPHIGRTAHVDREGLRVLALDVALPPETRIGYAGGGNDRVGIWLARLGLDVTHLGHNDLQGDLSRFTTIVVGIFAFGTRPDLAAARARLHRFVAAGGHLVTLYHRPSDGWDEALTPPRPIQIGSPSLRWRVTDPGAPVEVLQPAHPLLAGPNRIGPDDWKGWDKERGLYFAAAWDAAYEPLLRINDPGEAPLLGALISGRIGQGRHTHVSLALHHQLDRLVPGAVRLIANLVQPA
jgi:LmbE family N-acetylglucosaminyl deacetylase